MYGRYPITTSAIADGKIFMRTTEHSPNSPLFKGAKMIALNVTDGSEVWKISDWGNIMYGGVTPIADGFLFALNTYDSQIYSYGKGPSQLTVNAPQAAIDLGKSLIISGTVTDIAPGTKQTEWQDSPVSQQSQTKASPPMEYVYAETLTNRRHRRTGLT
jgi:outer membrane protein assembly factor BamB